jgi:uncharacterized membrane protein
MSSPPSGPPLDELTDDPARAGIALGIAFVVLVMYGAGSASAAVSALLVLVPLGLIATYVIRYGVAGVTDSGGDGPRTTDREAADRQVRDGLDRLRDRYAAGELDEAQFERKLETLLETDQPERAREYLDRSRAGDSGHDGSDRRQRPSDGDRRDGGGRGPVDDTGRRVSDRDPDTDSTADR